MRNNTIIRLIVSILAIAPLATYAADSEVQQRVESQAQSHIYGWQLMSEEERKEYREKMRKMKNEEAREEFRMQHQQMMRERAMERDIELPSAPAERGGMSPDGDMMPDHPGRQ